MHDDICIFRDFLHGMWPPKWLSWEHNFGLLSVMSSPSDLSPDANASSLHDDVACLPMLPSMLMRLSMLNADDPAYFDDVLKLVQADPGFAVRLLRLANSVASGSHNPASSISMALLRVGARSAVELMLAEKAASIFPAHAQWQRDLWAHSLLVASYMRRLAPMVMDAKLDVNEAYLAGLLHDIGRFLIFARMPDAFETIEDAGWNSPSSLIEAELKICACTHTQLAYAAMSKWGLPAALAIAARDHHETSSVASEGSVSTLVALLRDVDWLAMIVARDGLMWFDQSPEQCEDICSVNMRLRYRGDIAHRQAILRAATVDVALFLKILGMDDDSFSLSLTKIHDDRY